MKKIRAVVSGRVQGVWYRAHTRDKAMELGVVGFVRNLPDGTVEIVAQGDDEKIDALTDWALRGSPGARVEDVAVEQWVGDQDFSSFEVVH